MWLHGLMSTVRFLHTSDLQLGMRRSFLGEEAQARFDDARLAAVGRLGEIARARECAFIVMAGDVFDYNSVSPRTYGRVAERLRRIPVPVYLLPGNHDHLSADSVLRRLGRDLTGVHLLEDSAPVPAPSRYQSGAFSEGEGGTGGVELIGAPLSARSATYDPVGRAVAGLEPGEAIRIVVGHGQPSSYGEDKLDLIDVAALGRLISSGAVDYVALGDTHSAREVAHGVWFSGAPEVTDFREPDGGGENNSGKALVVEIEKNAAAQARVEVTEERVGAWRFEALERHLDSLQDVRDVLAELRAWPDKERSVIKYAFVGTLDLVAYEELQAGLAELEPIFGALFERTRLMDLHLRPEESELADLEMTGFVREALAELVSGGDTEAISLLFRLYRQVREEQK